MMTLFTRKVRKPFTDVVTRASENLRAQGFTIILAADMANALKEKMGIRFRNYEILSVCNPDLAFKLISLESHLGVRLLASVLIQEHENGEVEISAINPMESLTETLNQDIKDITLEISDRLRLALDACN